MTGTGVFPKRIQPPGKDDTMAKKKIKALEAEVKLRKAKVAKQKKKLKSAKKALKKAG